MSKTPVEHGGGECKVVKHAIEEDPLRGIWLRTTPDSALLQRQGHDKRGSLSSEFQTCPDDVHFLVTRTKELNEIESLEQLELTVASPESTTPTAYPTTPVGGNGYSCGEPTLPLLPDELYTICGDRIVRLPNQIQENGQVARDVPRVNSMLSASAMTPSLQTHGMCGVRLTTLTQFKSFIERPRENAYVAVTLQGSVFNDKHVRELVIAKRNLQILRLIDCPSITSIGYQALANGFLCLQELAVVNDRNLSERPLLITALDQLKYLQTLSIEKFESLENVTLLQLSSLTWLRELSFAGSVYGATMRQTIRSLTQLRQLDLRCLRFEGEIDLDFLVELTSLKSLFLSGTRCEADSVNSFIALQDLEVLHVDNVPYFNLSTFPALYELLMNGAMPKLRELVIDRCHLVGQEVEDSRISALKAKNPHLTIRFASPLPKTPTSKSIYLSSSPSPKDLFSSVEVFLALQQ
ncbi:hypothetical protein [Burkholderia sp. Bp8986]|uniref:hypothetical protein n=1 Tax=Burkholderia sp. Bp8986 TaxID=2184550 RepID=UPI000F5AA9B3|nr:hypothetical protein [Burkholderia sp. Bp8986]